MLKLCWSPVGRYSMIRYISRNKAINLLETCQEGLQIKHPSAQEWLLIPSPSTHLT